MGKTILLCDDNIQGRSIARAKLQEGGFTVLEASNGVECLKVLEETPPNLLVLDLVMPLLDGYKVLQMTRTNPKMKEIPVIVLSGRGQPEEVQKAINLGATDFLVKMRTNPKVLLDKVREILEGQGKVKEVPHFHLAIKEQGYDAVRIANEFHLPVNYRCASCGGPLLLELVPDFSHQEPWFTGHFVCIACR